MLRLAVTTASETLDRMCDPLAARGIDVEHLEPSGRVIDPTDPPARRFDAGFVYPSRLLAGGVVDGRHQPRGVDESRVEAAGGRLGGIDHPPRRVEVFDRDVAGRERLAHSVERLGGGGHGEPKHHSHDAATGQKQEGRGRLGLTRPAASRPSRRRCGTAATSCCTRGGARPSQRRRPRGRSRS